MGAAKVSAEPAMGRSRNEVPAGSGIGQGWEGVAAQLDRDYIREKTLEGQLAAAARGTHGGRPKVIDPDMAIFARALRDQAHHDNNQERFGVSPVSCYQYPARCHACR